MNQRPLFSAESEASIVGGLLLSNGAFDRIADKLEPGDFFFADNRSIYVAICGLLAAGRPADVVTVNAALGGDWMEKLGEILQSVPTSAHIEQYARVVREKRLERDLSSASETLMMLAHGPGPVDERLDAAQKLVVSLTETAGTREPQSVKEILPSFIEEIERRHENRGQILGIPTGLTDLDKKLSGLQPGLLYLVAGRPSMGKTALAMQFAQNAALHGKTSLVFSLEMSAVQLVERSVANVGKIDGEALRDGSLQGEDWEKLSAAVGRLSEAKFFVDDVSGLSPEQLRARARRVRRKHGLDLIVVDYLQLMQGSGDRRLEVVDHISRSLKLLAKELHVPVVAVSQLSRKCEERPNKRPIMSDLRESGSLEQDADVVIFVYRDEYYNTESEAKGIAEIAIAKQRMGTTGFIFSTFVGEYSMFADTEYVAREPMRLSAPKSNSGGSF